MRLGNLATVKTVSEKAMARYYRTQGDNAVGMILVSLADHYGYLSPSKWGKGSDPVERTAQRMLETYFEHREAVLPPRVVNGHQLMKALRLKPGPIIGKLLEAITEAQIGGKISSTKEALAFAKRSPLLRRSAA